MVTCDFCGVEVSSITAFTCSYCKKTFCPDHRLPFNHACTHINEWRHSSPYTKTKTRPVQSCLKVRKHHLLQDEKALYLGLIIAILALAGLLIVTYLLR